MWCYVSVVLHHCPSAYDWALYGPYPLEVSGRAAKTEIQKSDLIVLSLNHFTSANAETFYERRKYFLVRISMSPILFFLPD